MKRLIPVFASIVLATVAVFAQQSDDLTRLLRQPDVHENMIAFMHGGDIWVVSSKGGVASRLTSHEGLEQFPKFSPDGRWIAFTGEYDGTRQVYVIPSRGGQPRQLTFYNDVGAMPPRGGVDNQVLDWTNDGTHVLFMAHRLPWGVRMRRHYIVPVDGGMETPLEVPQGSAGMYSPDGRELVYTPIGREYRTWKRYRGGRAQDVWVWNLENSTARQLTTDLGTDNQPVWVGDKIYFSSDRDRTLNLFSIDPNGGNPVKVTNHEDFDVLWPSAGPDSIVYENGGYIYRYTPADNSTNLVPIRAFGDFKHTIPQVVDVSDQIESASISPTGVRAVFEARGEIFTVPAKDGEARNLTRSSDAREMNPVWSPDGSTIYYLSDASGEYEIWSRAADGSGEARKLTSDGETWRYGPVASPDGRYLAFGDRMARLQLLDIRNGKITQIDKGRYSDITDHVWSPDSRWLAWTTEDENTMSSIWVWSIDDGEKSRLTSSFTNEGNPVFDPKGRYIYFTSNRDYNLQFSDFEFSFLYADSTRVYVGVLAKDGPALFLPMSDEEPVTKDDKDDKDKKDKDKEKEKEKDGKDEDAKTTAVNVRIDPEDFEDRVRAIPGDAGTYGSLGALAEGPLFMSSDKLSLYDLEEKEEKTVLEGIVGYEVSADGKKLLYRMGSKWGIVSAAPGQNASEGTIEVDLETRIIPGEEWAQEYQDAWRTFRDWFYDENMHGLDWKAIGDKYRPLVAHISHRTDLDYILGELGGELNAGHVYVQAADGWQVERHDNALLGAEIVADASGYFRIDRIFPGENWHEEFRSPLTEPGVSVDEGDYILEVDGVSTRTVKNFYQLLQNKADDVITLKVGPNPSMSGSHIERVRPITRETNLRYLDWIESRREYIRERAGDRIGYIHLPNTAVEGTRELYKNFYPQFNSDALIIDARYNGGGFIPVQMIQTLERPILSYWTRRNVEPFMSPGFAHEGPKVALANAYSASGGDAFPYYFKKRNLGPLIGKRTWGGLIGLSGNPQLMDGGGVLVPTFRFLDPDGFWEVENVGVKPDIEVLDDPESLAKGIDPTLDAAIAYLLEELERNPPKELVIPAPPTDPDLYPTHQDIEGWQ